MRRLRLVLPVLFALTASLLSQSTSKDNWPPANRDSIGSGTKPNVEAGLVAIDPWIQQAGLTGAGANADFGDPVAIDGSTAVMGDYCCGPGTAYVFVKNGDGTWSQQAELIPSDGVTGDRFGVSVAVSGGTVVVGSPFHKVGANSYQGAVYVYEQNADGTWSQQAELTASDGLANDVFGSSVGVSGNTAVIGAPCHPAVSASFCGPGEVYVFVASGGTWSQQTEMTSSDGRVDDNFGQSVALDGSTAVVGAPEHNSPQAAYVFVGSEGTWSQQAELTPSPSASGENLGTSVALSGGTAVVGGNSQAYVFVQSGETWSQQAELMPSDGGGGFGNGVAVSGSTAVVGDWAQAFGSNELEGAAYVFVGSGGIWSQQQELTRVGALEFGLHVAISGDTILTNGSGVVSVFGSSGPLYTLSASPSSLTVSQGSQVTSTITVTPYNGFSGNVLLSASGLPQGVTAEFAPNPSASTSTLTLTASATATMGSGEMLVIGTSGSLVQTTIPTLTVPTTVSLSTTSLGFDSVAVDNSSVAKTLYVKNPGTISLIIGSIATSSEFAVSSSTCGASLGPKKECHVSVAFTPTQLGAVTGTLSFTDSGTDSPQTVTLSGTGVVQATLTPSSYTFPKTKVGTTSVAHSFTLKNNLPTTLTSISYSTFAPFVVSASTCGTTLESKKTCTISVTFSPTQTGKATVSLTVNDSANNSPQTVNLSGTGD